MFEFYHSVTLDEDKCMGCTHCMGRCPTQAIRVRDGKARILSERCIDCGECIRVCPHHAKRAVYDSMDRLKEFDYTIALPAPTLYGQFNGLTDIDYVLTGLLEMGFDDVFEVSQAAEIVSDATRRLFKGACPPLPLLSSACPAIVRLIRIRFPSLVDHVLRMQAPVHVAGRMAKEEAHRRTGIPMDRIGAFFISPCPAKITDIKQPIGVEETWVDGALSIADIYTCLVGKMDRVETPRALSKSGIIGVSWASSGGESTSLMHDHHLAADGIENVMEVLEELEGEKMLSLEFAELNACPGGCVGGVLAVENAYVARARIHQLRKYLPVSLNHMEESQAELLRWESRLEYSAALQLSSDLEEAMRLMAQIDAICLELPNLDCGSCGAPTCRTLAEDIVTRGARKNDCVFILRQQASSAGIQVSRNLLKPGSHGEKEPGDVPPG